MGMPFGLEVWMLQRPPLPCAINQCGGGWDSKSMPLTWKCSNTMLKNQTMLIISNDTWELVPPNYAHNLVSSKWVFWIKYNSDGSLECDKARLVAASNHQQAYNDFHDTFAPIIRPATIRLILSLAVTNHWSIRQLDVENAFLHSLLTEKVYTREPPGFIDSCFPSHVCGIKKAIYSLKEAPWA